ncbi:MAG: CDP-diacylglycerol--serine O-phosphatidyltransferase [bacterium]
MSKLRPRLRRPVKPKHYRGTHLLPNLLTSASIACGLLAIVYSMDGFVELAAWMILVAFVCDGLDGKVAKLMKVSSPLGVELDSLGDLISFGVAPAVMLRRLLYPSWEKLGISLVLVYVLCTALRLARYNVMAHSARKPHFTGLPCPAAAGFLASVVLVLGHYNLDLSLSGPFRIGIHVLTVILSVLMVSRVRYPDLAVRYVERRGNFNHTVVIALGLSLGVLNPPVTMLCCFAVYLLLSPLLLFRKQEVAVDDHDPETLSTSGETV